MPRKELSSAKRAWLAQRLRGGLRSPKRDVLPRRDPAAKPLLSYAQQRLWFFSQLEPQSALYNMPHVFRLAGPLDGVALEKALSTILTRHEVLRTRYTGADQDPIQIIDPPGSFQLPVADLSELPPAEREPRAAGLIGMESARRFDLAGDGMLRALLIRLGEHDHFLLLNMHHIASDAWSWGILFRELEELYAAHRESRSPQLEDLPIQYADYAAWQRNKLTGEALRKELDHWKQELAGAPHIVHLPSDYPRPPVQSFRGRWESLDLSSELARELNRLSRGQGATLFMTLFAVFAAQVWRYTSQNDLLLGCPIAGRTQLETEPLIGFFVNTLVLRARPSSGVSFLEFLKQVRETTLQAYAHQELPFEKLVEELRPARDSAHLPVVQLAFVLQNAAPDTFRLPGLRIVPLEAATGTAKFDLTMSVTESLSGLQASIEYNTDLFAAGRIRRMLRHYEALLRGVAADPSRSLGELPLLTPPEEVQLLHEWNNTTAVLPEESVASLFEKQVERTPGAIALWTAAGPVTYQALNERANRLAHYLKPLGVGPDVPVAVLLERSEEFVVTLLGILKAGGFYAPFDPRHPQERIARMLRDLRVSVLVTREKLRHVLPEEEKFKTVCLDDGAVLGRLSRQPVTNPPSRLSPEHLIYLLYTSGSTGGPKGVCVPHRAVVRLVQNTDYVRLGPEDTVAQISNCAFDAATFEIWGALLNGAKLIVFPEQTQLSPSEFSAHLRERGVNTLFVTTALFNQLILEQPGLFRGLRSVLVGGETLSPTHVAAALRHGPPERLLNVYGPTEATTFASWHPVEAVDESASIPIGRPIANTRLYLLDPDLNPVPAGVTGEIHVGGPGLARGYWEDPGLTAQKFVPDPFSREAGARLYRTGDLARFREDGAIEFLGRSDHQVKIRGFRVELEEIGHALRQHPQVRDCWVALSNKGEKHLAAYVVPKPGLAPLAHDLKSYLRQKLPDYMVPATLGFLQELPLNPNGKIDQRALPELHGERSEAPLAYQAPRDAMERELAAIWEELLRIQPVGIRDNFFELGGHSLLAVRMAGLMEKAVGQKVRVATIFQCPTIELLAEVLRGRGPEPRHSALVALQPKGSLPPLYLVHGAGGGMFWGYSNLCRFLSQDQPVYGLKSRGMHGMEEFERIEEMAAHYVQEIRIFQPAGPYYLGGYCFGGNVAYEMACQLKAAGQPVGLLGLIDCSAPNSSYDRVRWTPGYACKFVRNLFQWIWNFGQLSRERRREYVRWKLGLLRSKLRKPGLRPRMSEELDPADLADLSKYSDDQRKLWTRHIRALVQYHPGRYPGKVILFRTRGHPLFCSLHPANGWDELAAEGVEVQPVAGVHESMLEEPHVKSLAQALSCRLEKARRETDPQAS